jgi:hypothetical protein
MRASKGKEFIKPDENWVISEYRCHKKKTIKYFVRKFNRKLRHLFNRYIREKEYVAEN